MNSSYDPRGAMTLSCLPLNHVIFNLPLDGSATSQREIKKLLIIDARSYPAAVANRTKGGGCECAGK